MFLGVSPMRVEILCVVAGGMIAASSSVRGEIVEGNRVHPLYTELSIAGQVEDPSPSDQSRDRNAAEAEARKISVHSSHAGSPQGSIHLFTLAGPGLDDVGGWSGVTQAMEPVRDLIPEPSSMILLGVSSLGLLYRQRRQAARLAKTREEI